MWVISESGGLINLDLYDQVPIVGTQADEIEGVPNLAPHRAVVARKAAVDNEGEVRYLSTLLAENLSGDDAVWVLRLIHSALRKNANVCDVQGALTQHRAASNGTRNQGATTKKETS